MPDDQACLTCPIGLGHFDIGRAKQEKVMEIKISAGHRIAMAPIECYNKSKHF